MSYSIIADITASHLNQVADRLRVKSAKLSKFEGKSKELAATELSQHLDDLLNEATDMMVVIKEAHIAMQNEEYERVKSLNAEVKE